MDRERNHVLEDYWQEFSSFDDNPNEDDDEDASKTPDEGEAEEDWLREAGFQTLVDTELTEDDQVDQCEDMFATLTARQIAAVKKRLETVQRSKKRRHPVKQRAHVRDLFNNAAAAPTPAQVSCSVEDHASRNEEQQKIMSSPAKIVDDVPTAENRPVFKSATASAERAEWASSTRVVLPLPFLRTGHSGGFKLKDHTGSIDSESPTSVEVLRYESMISVVDDKDAQGEAFEERRERCYSEPSSLETGFQEISSRLQAVDETLDTSWSTIGNDFVQCADLNSDDRSSVRALALIEVSALLDIYGLVPSRRKPARKKGKDNAVFGTSLASLLELDQKRFPGCKIPLLYQWIFQHLHINGVREEGLMRLGGSIQKTQVLKSEIEKNYISAPNLVENTIRQASVHDVAVLLKQLIRSLPEPLLTTRHMGAFLQVPNIPNIQDQLTALNLLVLVLPDAHRELLQEFLGFLARVVEEELHNRMSLQNVAMIIAPNLFPPKIKKGNIKNNDLAAEVTVAALSSKVTQLLIKYRKCFGTVPPELLAQARLQKRRSLGDKKMKRTGGRKNRNDKNKSIKNELHGFNAVIKVHISSSKYRIVPVIVDEKTTAGNVVERVAETLGHMMDPQEQENREISMLQRTRAISEPIVSRHKCLLGAKKPLDCLKDHYLYQTRENVGDRMLDHNCGVLGFGILGPGCTWEVRCHH